VRFPWFDQLNAFFGPARLATLRADRSPYAMLRTAVVHAVLQSESTIVDLLREPPTTPTHVLLVALVVVNRRGTDNAIPVGLHHLHFAGGEPELVHGTALRATPDTLEIDDSRTLLRVHSPFEPEEPPRAAAPRAATPHVHAPLPAGALARAHAPEVRAHVARHRQQLERLRRHPRELHVYARATLRAFLQGLSVLAPEVGLAALALEGGRDVFRGASLAKLLERGLSSEEARHVLHDLEPTLQQLGHGEAREMLEAFLAEHHPLLGGR